MLNETLHHFNEKAPFHTSSVMGTKQTHLECYKAVVLLCK